MIRQHDGKLTMKQIEQLSDGCSVLLNLYHSYPNLHRSVSDSSYFNYMWTERFGTTQKTNKPNCIMKGLESYPGAWIFYDDENNAVWAVFSDGIWKKCFKGTSYELKIPYETSEKEFKKIVDKFFEYLQSE